MRGDFSRIRFNRADGYTAVMSQQGRVALDADANEQCFINDYLREVESVDVIGQFGAPAGDAGFQISVAGGEIEIGPGRYYVDGLLCENQAALSYDDQPHLLDATPSGSDLLDELQASGAGAVIQLYLQTWQRFVTPLDDPCLREPALGQADTTGRLQTVWRVVGQLETNVQTSSTGQPAGLSPCCQAMYKDLLTRMGGRMSASTSEAGADCGCQPVAAAGYQGVENQLYRVEIHQGGDETTATFKWSRDNGFVESAVTDIAGQTVTVDSLGPDANLGFQPQQWVELSDDNNLFGQTPNQPGALYQIQTIQPADPSMTLAGSVVPVHPAQHARVRRWDQTGPSASAAGIPLSAGTQIPLENGIEICFSEGNYRSGDYWTIPARTATGTIDWPPCGSDGNSYQPASAIRVRQAPLACIHWVPERLPVRAAVETFRPRPPLGRYTVDDCRLLFSPLTDLTPPATKQAIHIEKVNWSNDDFMTLSWLVDNGLTVTVDQDISAPLTGANFIVTLEPVQFQEQDVIRAVTPSAAVDALAVQTILDPYLRGVTIIEGEITTAAAGSGQGQTVTWSLAPNKLLQARTVAEIRTLIGYAATAGLFARLRIKLLGQMIFGTGANGSIFLDGKAFGQLGQRADNSSKIDLQLPSGEEAAASDFDGWFYLIPDPAILEVTAAYSAVTVRLGVNGVPDSVVSGSPPTVVTQEAIVTLNYPAVTPNPGTPPGPVNLSLDATSSAFASIQTPVAIPAGATKVTAPITVFANPGQGSGETLTVTITATLQGSTDSQTATFQLTGATVQFE